MKSCFVHNGPVAVHVLENGIPSEKAPSLLVIGGLWEPAERAVPILSGLSSHTVALSFRGRGLSSTPETGYDLDGHLSDIEAVVNHLRLQNYCVLGFSRGASYALAWSLQHQQDMRGLIVVDQPPVHMKPGPGYVDYWSSLVYLGVPILNYMRLAALQGLERDAEDVEFTSQLSQLKMPVSLYVGTDKEAPIPSNVSDEVLKLYKQNIPSLDVVEFKKSGHMIPDDEIDKYIKEIKSFIKKRCSL